MLFYLLVYRAPRTGDASRTDVADVMRAWDSWFDDLGAHLVDRGNPVFTSQLVTAAAGEHSPELPLAGYSVVRAADLAEATALAEKCPSLTIGGTVEVGELTLLNFSPERR